MTHISRSIVNGKIEERETVTNRGPRYIESEKKKRGVAVVTVITYNRGQAEQERNRVAKSLTEAQDRETAAAADVVEITADLAELDTLIAQI